jgi:hypothetical protein
MSATRHTTKLALTQNKTKCEKTPMGFSKPPRTFRNIKSIGHKGQKSRSEVFECKRKFFSRGCKLQAKVRQGRRNISCCRQSPWPRFRASRTRSRWVGSYCGRSKGCDPVGPADPLRRTLENLRLQPRHFLPYIFGSLMLDWTLHCNIFVD